MECKAYTVEHRMWSVKWKVKSDEKCGLQSLQSEECEVSSIKSEV